jgi:hypothetical protein
MEYRATVSASIVENLAAAAAAAESPLFLLFYVDCKTIN